MTTHFHVARITLEARSPLMIASGAADPNLDVVLRRDVNALPCIPATTLAGALRARCADTPELLALFGAGGRLEDTFSSHLFFSDALTHLAGGRPVDGRLDDPETLRNDPLWMLLRLDNPIQRDHVALGPAGVAEEHKKFQRGAVPAGARFTFELGMWGVGDDSLFRQVLDRLVAPGFRLGGARRSGYGEMRVEAIGSQTFDLTRSGDREAYIAYAELTLSETPTDFLPVEDGTIDPEHPGMDLDLVSEGFVLIGSSGPAIGHSEKQPDQTPYREAYIDWSRDGDKVLRRRLVIPGSAFKGALRHRTVFHFARMNTGTELGAAEAGVADLFGAARDESAGTGGAGKLFFGDGHPPDDDVQLEERVARLPHVGIDRFSGGVRRGVLFETEAIWKLPIRLKIRWPDADVDSPAFKAFKAALKDLRAGRLQIGADGGDGLGVFLDQEAQEANDPGQDV